MTARLPPRASVRGEPGFPKEALVFGAQQLLASDQLGGQDQDLSGSSMPVESACCSIVLHWASGSRSTRMALASHLSPDLCILKISTIQCIPNLLKVVPKS